MFNVFIITIIQSTKAAKYVACAHFFKKWIKHADFFPFLHTTDCDKFDENKTHVIINIFFKNSERQHFHQFLL